MQVIFGIIYTCVAIILFGACLLIIPFVVIIGGAAFFIGFVFYLIHQFIDYQKQEIEDQ